MADLSNKTVDIIKQFFEQNDLIVKLVETLETEIGTWNCYLELYQDKIFLGNSSGMGLTKEAAIANGYAELYKNFCNEFFMANPYWAKSLIDYNNKNNNYNFRSDEKILTAEEQLDEASCIQNFFNRVSNNTTFQKEVINYITDNKVVGLPYKNINDKNEIYLDPRITARIMCGMGIAEGATQTEALLQGISEIIEKQGFAQVVKNPSKSLYSVDLNNIDSPILKTLIDKIDEKYDLYLFDLSYTYEIPVVMSFLINRNMGTTAMNFGAAPVFELAAERAIVKLYQAAISYSKNEILGSTRIPYKLNQQPEYMFSRCIFNIDGTCMPMDYLKNIQTVSTYNHDIFIDKSSNEDYLKYYIDLTQKLNLNLYYLDTSLDKNFSTISIVVDGDNNYTGLEGTGVGLYDVTLQQAMRKLMKSLNDLFNNIYNNTYDPINILDSFNSYSFLTNIIGNDNILYILLQNYMGITKNTMLSLYSFFQIIQYDGNINPIPNEIINSIFFLIYKKYYLLQLYCGTAAYTKEEYLEIFNKYFNFNITLEDTENAFNQLYLIKKIYIEPLTEYIHSDKYLKLIKIFARGS